MKMQHTQNNNHICLICSKEIRQFEKTFKESVLQPSLFNNIEKKRCKIVRKIEQECKLIEDDYRSYTILFQVDLKKEDIKMLKRILLELLELKAKIEKREVLVTRIFYDCKKETKEFAGYRISSEFMRSKDNISNASRNSREEVDTIENIISVMRSISGLYKKFKKEDDLREMAELRKLTKL